MLSLSSNIDAEAALTPSIVYTKTESCTGGIVLGKYYETLMSEGNCNTWYIASCEKINADGSFKIDHLIRTSKDSDFKWKHPVMKDCIDLHPSSIVDCIIIGDWDISQERNMTFALQNHQNISSLVKQISINIENA